MVVQTGISRSIPVYASQEKYELRDAISALKAARLWDFVEDLPLGTNTVIGERESPLSGGAKAAFEYRERLISECQPVCTR